MNAPDKTHGVVVLFHLLHFFRRERQKLKQHRRSSHLVPPSHDLHEFLQLFPPFFVVSLILLRNRDQLRALNEAIPYSHERIQFGNRVGKPLEVFFQSLDWSLGEVGPEDIPNLSFAEKDASFFYDFNVGDIYF